MIYYFFHGNGMMSCCANNIHLRGNMQKKNSIAEAVPFSSYLSAELYNRAVVWVKLWHIGLHRTRAVEKHCGTG